MLAGRRLRLHPEADRPRSLRGVVAARDSRARDEPPREGSPVGLGALRERAAVDRGEACRRTPRHADGGSAMSRACVLLVDDDLALLQALPEALRLRMGAVKVDTAGSAAAALDLIAARDYDAIVTDIKMPGIDGLELLAEIRTQRPDTPTVM